MKIGSSILAICAVVLTVASAQAAPLGLVLNDSPDITSVFMDMDYNAGSDSMTVTGFSATIDDDGVGSAIDFDSFGTFDILASIDGAGNDSGGSLSITGDLTSSLGVSGTLLTGSLVDFGWTGTTRDIFEFLFSVTGGALATPSYYGLPGTLVGIIYDTGENVFDGDFGGSFKSSGFGSGYSDAAPIPEPTTLSLLALAGLFICRGSRRA